LFAVDFLIETEFIWFDVEVLIQLIDLLVFSLLDFYLNVQPCTAILPILLPSRVARMTYIHNSIWKRKKMWIQFVRKKQTFGCFDYFKSTILVPFLSKWMKWASSLFLVGWLLWRIPEAISERFPSLFLGFCNPFIPRQNYWKFMLLNPILNCSSWLKGSANEL